MGPITGLWLKEQTKLEILTVIETSQQQGVSARHSCSLLAIEPRRVVRWQQQSRQGQGLANLSPGPKDPLHRVLPEEIDQIVTLAKSQEYVDLSHRLLAVTAWDKGLFQASFSTVYRVLKEQNLMTARGPSRPHNGHSKAPVRKALTGPNQRWCWDISYLSTFQKGEYLYLYLLLDEWSRKAVQWRIHWQQTAEESRRLLAGGLTDQNILDLPEDQRPEVINDRGRQMKAKPIQRLCEDHGLPQLFARPRTPMTIRSSKPPSAPSNAPRPIPGDSWMTPRPRNTSVATLPGMTPSITIQASTASPRNKPIRDCGRSSSNNDAPKNLPSAADTGKKTKNSKPAHEKQTNAKQCPPTL